MIERGARIHTSDYQASDFPHHYCSQEKSRKGSQEKIKVSVFPSMKCLISFAFKTFMISTLSSRWDTGSNNKGEKHVAPGMSTIVNVERMGDEKAQEIYLLNLQIREITAKMGTPTLGIPLNPRDRSPSPEPIYNSKGVRVNTRSEFI